MPALSKNQLGRLNDFMQQRRVLAMINEQLQQNGLRDFEVQSVKFTSKRARRTEEGIMPAVKLCPHGLPAVEECSESGYCRWVCNH
jgi:hypothetical protein